MDQINKWSDFLCKSSLSPYLIECIEEEYTSSLPDSLITSLSAKIENKNHLKAIKTHIKQIKKHISKKLYEEITEELQEIKEDLKWNKSDRGKYVSEVQNWAQSFHAELKSQEIYENVIIGGHTERKVVFVVGQVKDQATYEQLLNYIKTKQPPYKLFEKIEIIQP